METHQHTSSLSSCRTPIALLLHCYDTTVVFNVTSCSCPIIGRAVYFVCLFDIKASTVSICMSVSGDLERVYTSLQSLAEYFEETNDMWLADHFRSRCLETSLEIKNDGRRKEGEAHCNMGVSYEAKGESMALLCSLDNVQHVGLSL